MKVLNLFCFAAILLISCQTKQPNWPHYIMTSLWVPQGAKDVHYYTLGGSYQVKFNTNECYPGKSFIQAMVGAMTSEGWRRLDYYSLDPKIKLNHARVPGGLWSSFVDRDGKKVYQWIDEWEDSKRNVVTYGLKYFGKYEVPENSCGLEVVVIYTTAELLSGERSEMVSELDGLLPKAFFLSQLTGCVFLWGYGDAGKKIS